MIEYKDFWISNYGRAVKKNGNRYNLLKGKIDKWGHLSYAVKKEIYKNGKWTYYKTTLAADHAVMNEFVVNPDIRNNVKCWHLGGDKLDNYYKHLYPLNQAQYRVINAHFTETGEDSEDFILKVMNDVLFKQDDWGNRKILKKITEIDKKIIICIASGGGSTGSGTLPYISEIAASNPDKIVVAVLLMPRPDEAIQKRLNAYNATKELMEVEGLGAIIFVDNSAYDDLNKINMTLVNMLDVFFTDASYSSGSNFDDSEKMKMLKDNGVFVLAMLSDKNAEGKHVTTQDMLSALTAKNIFLPINDDGVVNNIGIINQGKNKINEHEIVKAIGTPENIFTGANGNVNIACASGLSYPIEYIKKLGKGAITEQKSRMEKRKSLSLLEDLEDVDEPVMPEAKTKSKRKQISFDMLQELD